MLHLVKTEETEKSRKLHRNKKIDLGIACYATLIHI